MFIPQGIFRARVARRVVGLFVLSALVPVVVMASVSFFAVNRQLEDNSRERLGQLTRNAGQSILQQLRTVETSLRAARARLVEGPTAGAATVSSPTVLTLSVSREDGTLRAVQGESLPRRALDESELDHLSADLMILRVDPATPDRIEAALPLFANDPTKGMVWSDLLADSLWSSAETFASLSTVVDFCVLAAGITLHCTSGSERFPAAHATVGADAHSGSFDHAEDAGRFIVGHWSFYPSSDFDSPPWSVLIAEDAEAVHAPLDGFTTMFVLALVLAILLVVLLSSVQIRRTLEPLAALELGTGRIAIGDLHARVAVTSDDEFGALAGSFNAMATRLQAQFTQFEAIHAVGHAALAGLAKNEVIATALQQLPEVYAGRSAAVMSVGSERGAGRAAGISWLTHAGVLGGTEVELGSEDLEWLDAHLSQGTATGAWPPFVGGARRGLGSGPLVVFPHVVKGRVDGATLVELPPGVEEIPVESAERLRQIANQVAVALDDVRLVEELEALSWGALVAFARAIDAKSEWTAGHSERVTEMALGLAREMGFGQEEMTTLHRGGLLHDIGKIGVSNAILNKPGELTAEETMAVRLHPVVGARILSPIPAFASALPIVRHHHEHWDGTGYPDGLAGEEIHPLARVLAVADAYDAMASDRPYRTGRSPEVVLQVVIEDSGRHFEPRVVDALAAYLLRHELVPAEGSSHVVS
jgi:putative nucleotidyltransferase with HDIG domain